jgi:hypothetical protein
VIFAVLGVVMFVVARATKDQKAMIIVAHAPDNLPDGAHSTGPSRQVARFHGKAIGAPGGYVDPRLCVDARTGLPVELSSPKWVLVCHGGSTAKLTAVSLDGTEGPTASRRSRGSSRAKATR